MGQLQRFQSESVELRTWLVEQTRWRRFDFVRQPASFERGDRALCVDELVRPIAEGDDLRFVFEHNGARHYVFAERLPWDSAFFGYGVARLNAAYTMPADVKLDLGPAIAELVTQASARGIRYLFAPVFPESLALIDGLARNGFALIETRALYHMPLAGYVADERSPVRAAVADDIPTLRRTAREAVNAYDRFHADPFIPPLDADRLMEEWVTASIERGFADITLVPDVSQPQAFTTVRYNQSLWSVWGYRVAQTVLTAVGASCRGWHRRLVSETNIHLQALGVDHAVLPTQITNRAVIHNLEQLGYRYGRSEHIFRIVL